MSWKIRFIHGSSVATCLVILSCETDMRSVESVPEMAAMLERSRYRRRR